MFLNDDERKRMTARLEELGAEQVRHLATVDGFPHHWRVGVVEWLRGKELDRARPTQ